MILDVMDQVDISLEHEHIFVHALSTTFESLRTQFYETTSVGAHVSSQIPENPPTKSDAHFPQEDAAEAARVGVQEGVGGQEGGGGGAVGGTELFDGKVKDTMAALVDLVGIALAGDVSTNSKRDIWSLLCRYVCHMLQHTDTPCNTMQHTATALTAAPLLDLWPTSRHAVGCNNEGGGGNFSKVTRLVGK